MAKPAKASYVCSACSYVSLKWAGRCLGCNEFNTMVEQAADAAPAGRVAIGKTANGAATPASFQSVRDVDATEFDRFPSGIDELDRVLGGGIVPGLYAMVGGEPGAGKTTLTTQVLIELALLGRKVALISGEESKQQAQMRFKRLTPGRELPDVAISTETSAERIFAAIEAENFEVVVIDSINTSFSEESPGAPGSVGQMRACAAIYQRAAKELGCSVILVGQVTKDGDVAGPRMLEHAVDAFLMFEGDRREQYRILRGMKNRFGSTDEIGVFEMTGHGLEPVTDPSSLFLSDRDFAAAGVATTAVIEGTRPLLCEIQALVTPSFQPQPTRIARGIPRERMQVLLAVLSRKAGYRKLQQSDVYLNVAGGLKIDEPGVDIAICAAIASALTGRPLKEKLCVFGEVTLVGEVRSAPQSERRAKEAERQGLTAPVTKGQLRETIEGCLGSEQVDEAMDSDEDDLAAALSVSRS